MPMKPLRWIPVIALCLAGAAVVTGLVLTRPAPAPPPPQTDAPQAQAATPGTQAAGKPASQQARRRRDWLVDEAPLQTARQLEGLATTAEEKQFAHQAQRLGNHEVDLALTDALRSALENPPAPTPQSVESLAAKNREAQAVQADQKLIAELTRQLAAATGRNQEGVQTQLDVAKAQLELDQDELDQASENLERVGGDPQARIRRLQAAHAAADVQPPPAPPAPALFQAGSLMGKLRLWTDARAKTRQLAEAEQEARGKVQVIAKRREARAARVAQEKAEREDAKQVAASLAQYQSSNNDPSIKAAAQATVTSLQHFMADQRMLSDLGRRMQDLQEQAELYGTWGAVAAEQERSALHVLLQWGTLILAILAAVLAADRLFARWFLRLAKDNKRVGRMLKVVQYAVLALGIVGILLVLFGLPSQMTTLFGLAGAGLTVALKDFIVAFFGWFILVGRNGIHVGDWVEINGVGGEVVEIGLLRTMVLETGSWTDAGHPTGRIASFVNSFAMEGHFFNFSTSGQWMWDEIQTLVPGGQDPYPMVDAIRLAVERETEANAHLAEQEWRESTRQRRAQGFSARPALNVVPVASGVEIRIRYITRAYERHLTRDRLNRALVELLHGRREQPAEV